MKHHLNIPLIVILFLCLPHTVHANDAKPNSPQPTLTLFNRALGGRSSRTYLTEGLWDKVLANMKTGDFVLMQFGHNDGGSLTQGRGRASIKGNGEETQELTDEKSGKKEVVH